MDALLQRLRELLYVSRPRTRGKTSEITQIQQQMLTLYKQGGYQHKITVRFRKSGALGTVVYCDDSDVPFEVQFEDEEEPCWVSHSEIEIVNVEGPLGWNRKRPECYKCSRFGHWARECKGFQGEEYLTVGC